MPSHYLNQCWIIVNWTLANIFQWKLNQNTAIFIVENAHENVVCEMRPSCLGLNELKSYSAIVLDSWNSITGPCSLTHCGLVTPYGNRYVSTLAQVMVCCLTAPSHYLNQYWFLICDICLRAISQLVLELLFCIMRLKIILLKLLSFLSGYNELIVWDYINHGD